MIIQKKNTNRTKGILGSIFLHVIILTALCFLGLKSQDPPPKEEGISINFGFMEDGSENIQPEQQEEQINEINEEKIVDITENKNDIVTQSEEETPILKEKVEINQPVEKETEEDIIEKKEEPTINKKALYPGKKPKNNNSNGITQNKLNQGMIEGEENINNYKGGGIGQDGNAYQLGGRNVAIKAKPEYNIQVEGKVVVIITVDRMGNVINAITGAKGSTTLNKRLLEQAKLAALKTKFESKPTAPLKQQGKIIYSFRLN